MLTHEIKNISKGQIVKSNYLALFVKKIKKRDNTMKRNNKNKTKNKTITCLKLVLAILLVLILGYAFIGKNGYQYFVQWYITLAIFSIVTLPITVKMFKKFKDAGYIFSKAIGLVLSGFLMWVISLTHILKFNLINSYLCIGIILLISIIILYVEKKKNSEETINIIKEKAVTFLGVEFAFLVVFLLACYIKSFNPIAYGTEKFMDFGFMKAISQTDYMPPKDMWFSGQNINYYYIGQYLATFLSKASAVSVEYGYNFMLATIFAIAVCSVYSIVNNVIRVAVGEQEDKRKIYSALPVIGAIIATIAVNLAGNMHFVIYGMAKPLIAKLSAAELNYTYKYWDSTRFIGYNPDTSDKTIHEFPSYSYVLGDLHAHVINIIFVLVGIALLFAFLLNNKEKIKEKFNIREVIQPIVIFFGIFIGFFKTINFWDYPIYTVVGFLVFLYSNLKNYKRKKDGILATIVQVVTVFITSYIISLPFTLTFQKMSSQIKVTYTNTPAWQLLILWGVPTFSVLYYFIGTMFKKLKKDDKRPWLIRYIENLSISDAFIIILGCSAIGLVIAPETVYVKDIYVSTQYRANTMFKLTYQSFIMFGICLGYIITTLFFIKRKILNRIVSTIIYLLVLLTSIYGGAFTFSWFGNVMNISKERTLDGSNFLTNSYISGNVTMTDDYNIIKWINENTNKDEVVLEEQGADFTYSNRVSTFTGRQTVIGWRDHEWLWRSVDSSTEMPKEVKERIEDVKTIYTEKDLEKIKNLIEKYNISYIIIGYNERTQYATIDENQNVLDNEEILKSLGEIVYTTNENNLESPSYIIKIN